MEDEAVVHIIDDDESLRSALGSLFRSTGLDARLYESVAAFMAELPPPERPGCLVLDVRMPGMSGLEFQQQLEQLGVGLPAIMMTGHGDIPMTVSAMKAGAVDFLAKPFRDQDMLDAVSAALAKDRQRRSEFGRLDGLKSLYASLSPRERQVMALVSTGLLNKQVAGELNLSEITVKIHRGSVMRKMGAKTLADLVRMADALGLAPE